jgi:DNA invertase Pin-like site-specific DNA recombinase
LAEQERPIKEQDWQLTEMFVEQSVSGSMPLAKRPQGARLLRALRPDDIVISSKLDRCFRSAIDGFQAIEDFKRREVSLC